MCSKEGYFNLTAHDLPVGRVTATNKPFKFSGVDYLGLFVYRQNRSDCKAGGASSYVSMHPVHSRGNCHQLGP